MLRKQALFGCTGGLALLSLSPPSAQWSHSSILSNRMSVQQQPCRRYATSNPTSTDDNLSWPTTSTFTPYDLFKQERGAPYSKQHFYELVRIYHPDRPCNGHPLCKDISHEVRLQRYRLIVAAHEILSDPIKRAAYDKHGTGWQRDSDHTDTRRRGGTPGTGSYQYGPYTSNGDPIFSTGTWEDWERWQHRCHPPQMQNTPHRTFLTFIFLVAMLGGAIQVSWLTGYRTSLEQRIQEVNERCARLLAGRREQTADQFNSFEARVQNFLIRRDPSGYGLNEDEEGVYQQLLASHRHSPLKSSVSSDSSRD